MRTFALSLRGSPLQKELSIGWRTYMKRRLRRFGFDILKLSTSQIRSQEQSNSECPLNVLYTLLCFTIDSHWCTRIPKANFWYSQMLYIHLAWGFLCCSFRLRRARGKASECGASDDAGLHVFFISVPERKT